MAHRAGRVGRGTAQSRRDTPRAGAPFANRFGSSLELPGLLPDPGTRLTSHCDDHSWPLRRAGARPNLSQLGTESFSFFVPGGLFFPPRSGGRMLAGIVTFAGAGGKPGRGAENLRLNGGNQGRGGGRRAPAARAPAAAARQGGGHAQSRRARRSRRSPPGPGASRWSAAGPFPLLRRRRSR